MSLVRSARLVANGYRKRMSCTDDFAQAAAGNREAVTDVDQCLVPRGATPRTPAIRTSREATRAQLVHQEATVDLHGYLTGLHFAGNLLVQQSGGSSCNAFRSRALSDS